MYEKLKETMAKQDISANRLAMQAYISPSDFYNAINGQKPFYPAWRKRVADVLGVKVSDIFDESDE